MRFADGTASWRNRSVGKGSLICADERLYLYAEDGVVGLAEATPDAYRQQGRFRLSGSHPPTWAPNLVISNGKLIVRNQEHVYAATLTVEYERAPDRSDEPTHQWFEEVVAFLKARV
jgi:hypothetical protein